MQILKIRKAFLALGLKEGDEKILRYLTTFSDIIPIQTLHCIHVLPKLKEINTFQAIGEGQLELDQEVLEAMIKKTITGWDHPDMPVIEFEIKEGHPLGQLIETLKEKKGDFVVIGQQVEAKDHGIMASQLIRKIDVDALIVPESAEPDITHIMVPIDFSPYSIRAVKAAIHIWEQLNKKPLISLVNVYELPNLSVYKISRDPDTFKAMIKERKEEALDLFISNHAPSIKEVARKVVIEKDLPGIPQYLLQYAEKEKVDFVIMGAKGYSNIELILIGSVTEKWLNKNQRIPTLVLK